MDTGNNVALATTNGTAVAPAAQWDARQIDIIKRTIAPGISDDELYLFGLVCQRTGLDPFFKQIYAIKRGGKMTMQTGIDGYRLLADRTGAYAGSDEPLYDTEEAVHPTWAKVTVWKIVQGQRVAFSAKARWDEYNAGNDMWKKMGYLMLGKCAESLALRKAFPAELSGVYTTEEMHQAEAERPVWATDKQIAAMQKASGLLGIDCPPAEELRGMMAQDVESILEQYRRQYQIQREQQEGEVQP